VRSLVIGLKYSSATLGYYNRGKQFPQFLINSVNGAVQSVMLPAMSAEQENKYKVKSIMRNAVMMSAYIIFPIMAGLAGVAEPLVKVLLTDKWLPCVPYLQIYCFSFAFYPVHTSNLQAINAMGRSDIFLKLEIIKKSIGLSALAIAVFCFKSPIAIALTGAITTLLSCFINAAPNRKLIDYSYFEQMRDILPSFGAALGMLAAVLAIGLLPLAPIYLLLIQIPAGIAAYLLISVVFRMRAFGKLWGMAKKFLKK
jgi:O-antigen/teichoic acid export membrane protein